MKQASAGDQVLPYPKSRRFLEAAMASTHHKPMIHGLLEVDVTDARAVLRNHQTRTGESLSFTAFIIACLARAVDENKAVHALRWGSSRVVLFADVDVLTWVERDVGGQQIILPYIFRSANHKTVDQIHREMRTAQTQDLSKATDGGAKALQLLLDHARRHRPETLGCGRPDARPRFPEPALRRRYLCRPAPSRRSRLVETARSPH